MNEHLAKTIGWGPARVRRRSRPLPQLGSVHHLLQTACRLAPLAYPPCTRHAFQTLLGMSGCCRVRRLRASCSITPTAQAAALLPRHPVRSSSSEQAQGTTATMRQSLVYHEQRGNRCEARDSPLRDSPLTSSTRHGCHWCVSEPSFSPRPCAAEARRQGAQEFLPLPPLGPRRRLRRSSARTVDLATI